MNKEGRKNEEYKVASTGENERDGKEKRRGRKWEMEVLF